MKKIYVALLIFLTFLLLVIGIFVIWASSERGPQREAIEALQSDDLVEVQIEDWIIFRPKSKKITVGLILYPGARVDIRSYSPAARAIASRGYIVVIVPMPLNLAVFGINRASEVMEAFPHIARWVIAGHSVGGSIAASFVDSNPSAVEGLVLWSSHPANNDDLSGRNLMAVSIYETLDGLSINRNIDGTRHLLPPQTCWVPIEGGTHAQFGWYGPQKGENVATISQKDQQEIIINATLDLLDRLGD